MNSREFFAAESPDIPEMVELREKYSLDQVVAGKNTEFDKIIALRNWVQGCWEAHGYDRIPESNNSLRILQSASQGKVFNCHYYAVVFVQCTVALGFKARRLRIGIHPAIVRPGNNGHIVSEIWCSDLHKWAVMDPDMNAHYEKDGIPLNALEIHDAWVTQQLGGIRYVQGNPVPKMLSRLTTEEQASKFVFGAYDVMDYYFQILVEMRNNWLSSNKPSEPKAVCWIDRCFSDYSEKVGKTIDNVLWTDDPNLIYWNEE